MGQLGKHGAAFTMDRIRQRLITGNDGVVQVDQGRGCGREQSRTVHGSAAGNLHRDARGSPLSVVTDIALAGYTLIGEPGHMGGYENAVAQCALSDLDRLE